MARARSRPAWGCVYLELGRVQRLLGQRQEALESLAYGRGLSPIAEFSEEESQVYRDLGDPDRPAVALLEGLFIDPRAPRLRDEIVQFYKQTAPLTCAVETRGNKSLFNPQCPLVHGHLCQAGHNVALGLSQFRETGPGDGHGAKRRFRSRLPGEPVLAAMPRPGAGAPASGTGPGCPQPLPKYQSEIGGFWGFQSIVADWKQRLS